MTRRLIIAVVSIAVIVTVILLAKAFPSAPRSLKQNMYQKNFTDYPYELASFEVIILYETETDDTWKGYWRSSWGLISATYNVTVLLRPTYINESMISNVNVIDSVIGIDYPIAETGHYYPAQAAPVDFGINLMDFWMNGSAWCALSQQCYPIPASVPTNLAPESKNLYYQFAIRTIQTNGTRFIFSLDDSISILVSD